ARILAKQNLRGVVSDRVTHLFRTVGIHYQVRVEGNTIPGQGAFVALKTAKQRTQRGSTDVRNAFATRVDQMLRGQRANFFVVDAHEMRGQPDETEVNQNVGNHRILVNAVHVTSPVEAE